MHARTAVLALLSGLSALLVVGVAVTELASARIEFSLFVGIPAGVAAGLAAAAYVFARLEDPDRARHRPALALATFGAVFVVALLVATLGAGFPNSVALPIAAAMGAVAAVGPYLTA